MTITTSPISPYVHRPPVSETTPASSAAIDTRATAYPGAQASANRTPINHRLPLPDPRVVAQVAQPSTSGALSSRASTPDNAAGAGQDDASAPMGQAHAAASVITHEEGFDRLDITAKGGNPDGAVSRKEVDSYYDSLGISIPTNGLDPSTPYKPFGFDDTSIQLLSELEQRVRHQAPDLSPEKSAWVVNRIIGGFSYGGFLWDRTAGNLNDLASLLHLPRGESLKEIMISLGYSAQQFDDLKRAITAQHDASAHNGKADLTHQAITVATALNPYGGSIASNTYAWLMGISLVDLAGWAGDTTHAAPGWTPDIDNSDYKADLDAVNIAAIVRAKGLDYTDAASQYYSGLDAGKYTRAEKFLAQVDYSYIRNIILRDSGYKYQPGLDDAMLERLVEDLNNRNPQGYWFLKSLHANSNDLLIS